jgi:hypothetical protein
MSGRCSRPLNSSPSYKFGTPNAPDSLGGATDPLNAGSSIAAMVHLTKNAARRAIPRCITSRTGKEFTLGVGCEKAVVFSSRAVVLGRIHPEHPPALFEIETLASAEAASGNHYRPALLLRQTTLLG